MDMQVAIAERASTARDGQDLCKLARQLLERHPHFRGRGTGVKIEQEGRNLFLSGCLPSFYLKQMVQEAVRRVPGVQNVINQIDVISANGVSSVRN
jgi:osmotically-inducible protein OsmY